MTLSNSNDRGRRKRLVSFAALFIALAQLVAMLGICANLGKLRSANAGALLEVGSVPPVWSVGRAARASAAAQSRWLASTARWLGVRFRSASGLPETFVQLSDRPLLKGGVLSGPSAVIPDLDMRLAEMSAARAALLAPASLLCVLAALLLSPVLARLGAFVAPPALALSSVAFGTPCLSCGTTASSPTLLGLSTFVLGVVFALALWPRQPTNFRVTAVAASAAAALGVQVWLQWREPKLCPWCLLCGSVCIAVALTVAGGESSLPMLSASKATGFAFSLFAAFVGFEHLSAAAGYARPWQPKAEALFEPKPGLSVVSLIPGEHGVGPRVFLATLPGRHACAAAVACLDESRIPYTDVPFCSIVNRSQCLDTHGRPEPAPTLLAVDSRGVVRVVQVGWPGSIVETDRLLNQIRKELGEK